MANLLITGASGGIGKQVCQHLSPEHRILTVSRNPLHESPFEPCDLASATPQWRDSSLVENETQVDWIIHLATSYRVEDDLAMLEHLLQFAAEHRVKNFLYISSWVVHFPQRLISASYIEMKRRCEQRLLKAKLEKDGIDNLAIIRPSVVLGPGLAWSRTLTRLAPWSWLLPTRLTRSFVSSNEVSLAIEKVISGETKSNVVTVLGTRQSLARKATQHRRVHHSLSKWVAATLAIVAAASALLVASNEEMLELSLNTMGSASTVRKLLIVGTGLAFFGALVQYALPYLLGAVSDYFAGFVDRFFEPTNEADLIALCHRDNDNIRIRGYDNAKLYFQRPHSSHHTTISLRKFNQVLEIDPARQLITVQAGTHFGKLLPVLNAHGLGLENYPNYHFISVGACIATAVHGSNLDKPFLVDLVQSIRYYDREDDVIHEAHRSQPSFAKIVFDCKSPQRRVILSVQLRTCFRQYYELSSQKQAVQSLRFDDATRSKCDTQHYEVRINSPHSSHALLQSYRPVRATTESAVRIEDSSRRTNDSRRGTQLLSIKADQIGRKWNLLQRNQWTSLVTSWGSRWFINYEWFFAPDEFLRFWDEISGDRSRYRLYKLLIRTTANSLM